MAIRKGNTELKQQQGHSGWTLENPSLLTETEQHRRAQHRPGCKPSVSINRQGSRGRNVVPALGEEGGFNEQQKQYS